MNRGQDRHAADRPATRHTGLRLAAPALLLLLLSACARTELQALPPPSAAWPAPAAPAPRPPAPPPPGPALTLPDALSNDPEAQRFSILKSLAESGLVPAEEAQARRDANLGALLPYSAPPPAAGLDVPLTPQPFADRLARLTHAPDPAAPEVQAERGMLLDYLLPRQPRARTKPPRQDPAALRLGRGRVGMLLTEGLVTPDENQREVEAIDQAEQALAAKPAPPPAAKPAPPKRRPRAHAATAQAPGKPGDVPAGAIPAGGSGPVGVHLLSMASASTTDKAVEALKKDYPELAALQFKAVKTDIPDLGTTYRLLAGPLPADQAEALCRSLRTKGQSCAVSSFDAAAPSH